MNIKKQINKRVKEIKVGRGYKGGYFVTGSDGWNEDVETKKELKELIFKEIEECKNQNIAVAIYDVETNYQEIEEGYYPIY